MARKKNIDELKEQKAKIEAQIKQIQDRERDAERKQRTHALIVYGGMLESVVGDWKEIDPEGLMEYLGKWSGQIKKAARRSEAMTASEAAAAVREFERRPKRRDKVQEFIDESTGKKKARKGETESVGGLRAVSPDGGFRSLVDEY